MGNTHKKNLFPPYRVRKEKKIDIFELLYRSALVAGFFALMFFLAFSCIIVFVGAVKMYGDYGLMFTTIYIFIVIAICIDINNYYFNRVEKKKV